MKYSKNLLADANANRRTDLEIQMRILQSKASKKEGRASGNQAASGTAGGAKEEAQEGHR